METLRITSKINGLSFETNFNLLAISKKDLEAIIYT